jgi:hypothetical protein
MQNSVEPPKKIETKINPFALPKATTESLQVSNVKSLKFNYGKEPNFFYIFMGGFMVVITGILIYILFSLNQLQRFSQSSNNNIVSTPVKTIEVSDEQPISQTPWANREIKINNNVVWQLQLPATFIESTIGASDGTNIFNGDDNGQRYRVVLSFPLFANYPNGNPETLRSWIQSELAFLKPEDSLKVSSESFLLQNNLEATLLLGMKEITADSGNARIFGQRNSLVLYIDKTRSRNYSKITLIPQGEYNEQTARAFIERLASSLKF